MKKKKSLLYVARELIYTYIRTLTQLHAIQSHLRKLIYLVYNHIVHIAYGSCSAVQNIHTLTITESHEKITRESEKKKLDAK